MGRSKLKRKLSKRKLQEEEEEESTENQEIPIENLPKKYLWMRVKSGTKLRKVLSYAIKEFSNNGGSVIWSAAGQGIGKAVSCAEIFKKQRKNLHQITKLRYIKSKKSTAENEKNSTIRRVPEIHILLTENVVEGNDCGYQAPGDEGEFSQKVQKDS